MSLLGRVRERMRADRRAAESSKPTPRPARPAPPPAVDHDVERLEAEARYHRERLALYRARTYASKPTSSARLRELERAAAYADERLQRARHA